MSESIYAPPESDVSAPPDDDGPRYYVVAPVKFLLLSIMSFGLYFVYWFYKNWQLIKVRDSDGSWPIPRAIFYIFFTHALFADIDIRAKERDADYSWDPTLVASIFVALALISIFYDRLIPDRYFGGWYVVGSFSLVFIQPLLLLQAQKAINFASHDDKGATNRRLSAANIAWLVVCALWWVTTIIGLLMILDPTFLDGT